MTALRPVADANVEFQDNMVALVRALGLHKPDQTPCGQPSRSVRLTR